MCDNVKNMRNESAISTRDVRPKGNALIAPSAINILSLCAISPGAEYSALTTAQINALTAQAELYGYRKPKNLDGTKARHFHAFLARKISGEWE